MERRSSDPFAELFGEFPERLRGDRWRPSIDVYETEAAVVVRAEIAGAQKSSLRVAVEGDTLRIRGERVPPQGAAVTRHHQMEIVFGPFECSLRVSVPFDRERVSAHYEDGLLTVELPRKATRRQIEVESEGPSGS